MQVKIFTIPLLDGEEINEEMNRFLRGNKVIEVEEHLVTQEHGNYFRNESEINPRNRSKESRKIRSCALYFVE